MMCSACGFENYPCDGVCGHCRRTILEGEQLEEARRKWEALEPRSQAEFLENTAKRQIQYREYLHVLRQKRWIYTVVGGLLAGVAQIVNPMIFVFSGSAPTLLMHILTVVTFGGLASYRLHCRDGGAIRGGWYFCLAAIGGLVAETVLMTYKTEMFPSALATMIPDSSLMREPLHVLVSFAFSLIPVWGAGAFLGIHIEQSRDFWRSTGWYIPAIPPEDAEGHDAPEKSLPSP